MKKKRVAILGAGPAGLSAAYELSKYPGYEIVIYEASSEVAGMAGSIDYHGQIVDFGPHRFFSKLEMPNRLWDEVLGDESVMIKRLTRMYYEGRFYKYPVDLVDVIKTMPLLKLLKIGCSYLYAKLFPIQDDSNYENWVINMFGRELYLSFFKYYNEKLRGVPSHTLGSDWVKQRIKGVSVTNIIKKGFQEFLGSKKKTTIKSWVDEFKYPKYGNIHFYKKLKEKILASGAKLYLDKKITMLELKEDHWDIAGESFDEIISTIPIHHFFRSYAATPPSILHTLVGLRFRGIVLVYATIDATNLFPDNRIYLHSTIAGRLTNFNNRSPHQIKDSSRTYVVLEYRDDPEGELWNLSQEAMITLAKKELSEIVKRNQSIISDCKIIKIPHGYPILLEGYASILEEVKVYTKTLPHLQLIGRSGSFKYNNQDHSLYMGYLAARNIVEQKNFDLRQVNADEEYHEEEKL